MQGAETASVAGSFRRTDGLLLIDAPPLGPTWTINEFTSNQAWRATTGPSPGHQWPNSKTDPRRQPRAEPPSSNTQPRRLARHSSLGCAPPASMGLLPESPANSPLAPSYALARPSLALPTAAPAAPFTLFTASCAAGLRVRVTLSLGSARALPRLLNHRRPDWRKAPAAAVKHGALLLSCAQPAWLKNCRKPQLHYHVIKRCSLSLGVTAQVSRASSWQCMGEHRGVCVSMHRGCTA